jgi:DinB superfamily
MIKDVLQKISKDIETIFDNVNTWFNMADDLLDYIPSNEGWTIRQILEHISLTNHYLLILIRKGARKALERSKNKSFHELALTYDLDWDRLHAIGMHKSFEWNRPAHMEPTGSPLLSEVKITLKSQREECLDILYQMAGGEGILYKTTMTVNHLGKIDVYHYIYFLVQHAKRHLSQMEKIKAEFEKFKQ